MTEQDLRALSEIFAHTLSPSREAIKQAETQLKVVSKQPGYSINVLKLLALDAIDGSVRQAASVNFKNLVKYRWVPSEADVYGGAQPLNDVEKVQIKSLLPGLMLNTPPLVQAQLSEALSIICSHDFPAKWPSLLPELVERLKNADLRTMQGVLTTANSIFKRYRNQYSSNELVNELEQAQNAFAPALLETVQKLAAMLPQAQADIPSLKTLLSCTRLAYRVFFSLNHPGLTPLFESQFDTWMTDFHAKLQYVNPAIDESDPEKESVLDAVKAAVCQNVELFMEKEEEDFSKYLQTFVTDVWSLLLTVTLKPGQDNLAMSAIRFLTTVSKSVHHRLFADPSALKQICESIVVPNLQVRPEDEEVFEMNPIEYIRRDAEGSDSDTRRRAAADLVKSLTERFPGEVTQLFSSYVDAMLQEYARNPAANWKSKDCAIYLVTALTVTSKTGAQGATQTNQFVNVMDFFAHQVLPELQSPQVNDFPILKADAIKFVLNFRSVLPKETCIAIFPNLINLLTSEYNVVHSYAANTIERLLSLKENGRNRFAPGDLGSQLQPLLERLFAGFKLPESSENEYLMKCVMRVIGFVGPAIAPVSPICLQALAQILVEVCKNPKNPGFNHFLFESVAALIKNGTAANPDVISTFEEMLFPAFDHVLQQDVQEFHPYVFQVFAQLVELRSPPLPAIYLQIFPPLLSPVFWERSGNVPALVRLLQAYLAKAPEEVVKNGHLVSVLGVFQKLIASKAHDHEGFYILNTVVEYLPLASYQDYLNTIWTLLFTRMQSSRTNKFVRHFLVFVALFICKHGPSFTQQSVDKVQPGIFFMILQQVWLPNMPAIDGPEEEKVMAVATTKLLCECQPLMAHQELWNAFRELAEKKLTGKEGASGGQEDEEEFEESQGYSAAYAKLANASKPERQVLAEIQDPRVYFESSMARLYAPGAR